MQGNFAKASEMANEALLINKELGLKSPMAENYACLGLISHRQDNLSCALRMYLKALKLENRKENIALLYCNLGSLHNVKTDKTKVREYWQKSIDLYNYIGSPEWKDVQNWLDALH
jgi:tetratricopeptide (TPR) repeat protein